MARPLKPYRTLLVGALAGWLSGADLTTTLSVTARATDDSPVTYGWHSLGRPALAGVPVVTAGPGRGEATILLRDAAPGDYRFQVVVEADGMTPVSDEIVVTVRPASGPGVPLGPPSPGESSSGSGGCGLGSSLGILVAAAYFLRRGGRS